MQPGLFRRRSGIMPFGGNVGMISRKAHRKGDMKNGVMILALVFSGVASAVDPLIGTSGTGHAFPGPCRPFGLVQPSPETGNGSWKYCSGYCFDDPELRGQNTSAVWAPRTIGYVCRFNRDFASFADDVCTFADGGVIELAIALSAKSVEGAARNLAAASGGSTSNAPTRPSGRR